MFHFPKAENGLVNLLFIFTLAVCEKVFFSQRTSHFPFIIRNSGTAYFLVKPNIMADPPTIQNDKPPEIHGFAALRFLSDTDGPIFFCIFFFKLQKQIAGRLVSAFLSQKIVFHPPVAGAKWIQSAWRTVAIQHEGNKALGRDGFTGTILSPEKQFSILKLKIFFIIQPEVHKPDPVHFPTVIHSSIPPLKSCG